MSSDSGADSAVADPLDTVIGGATVRQNLEDGVTAGRLIRHADGTYELRQSQRPSEWIRFENAPHAPCTFLHDVLFEVAYARAAVPFGCRDCYKVKVNPRSVSELVAVKDLAADVPARSKWGPEVDIPYSQTQYAGFFYTLGLDAARRVYKSFRARLNSALEFGPQVSMLIKRGCTDYEMRCGRSDRWTFQPGIERLEAAVAKLFRLPEQVPQTRGQIHAASLTWLATAHRIGDQSYLQLTGGQPLYPPTVTYDPDGDSSTEH